MATPRTPRTPRTPGSSSPAQPRQPASREQTYAKSPAKPSSPSQPSSSSIGRTPRTPRSTGITPSRSTERSIAPTKPSSASKVSKPVSQPTKPKPSPKPSSGGYQVKPGDTMSAIAKRSGVKLEDLIEANLHIRNPSQIYAGQQLSIPKGKYPLYNPVYRGQPAGLKEPVYRGEPVEFKLMSSKQPTYGPVAKPQAKYGDSGPSVTSLQHWLSNHGYDPGPIDGKWGDRTEAAYQAAKKAGGVDWTTIFAKTDAPSTAVKSARPSTPYSQAGGLGSGYGKPTGGKSISGGYPLYEVPSSVIQRPAASYNNSPAQLSQAAASRMAQAAKYNGAPIMVGDAYRTVYTKPDSEHNKGNAVDLDQGYYKNDRDPRYLQVKAALEKAGFKVLRNPYEWWHFSLDGT